MKSSVVYADLTFLINLTMDLSLLWVTSRLLGVRLHYKRWLAASCLGALYGTGIIVAGMTALYSLPAKLAVSVLLVYLAFKPASWREFKKALAYFYLISFLAAGAVLALSNTLSSSLPRANRFWIWLAGGIVCLLVIGYAGQKLFIKRIIPELLRFTVSLNFAGCLCEGTGFLDTGNGLCDPLTRRPVIVVEYELLKDCLPADLKQALNTPGGEEDVIAAASSCSWSHRIRIIPFRSLGRKHGLMVGLRADEVVVHTSDHDIFHQDLVVGVYRDRLSHDRSYRMLIPATLVHARQSV